MPGRIGGAGICSCQMADDDPETSDPDKGIDDPAKHSGRDPVMDGESEKSACGQGGGPCPYERQICHCEPAHDKTDDKDDKIVDAEEGLDRCKIFPFILGGRQQVERGGRTAGSKKSVADAADDTEDRTGQGCGVNSDPIREDKEKDRDGDEHEAQEQIHDAGTDLGGQDIDDPADDGGGDQEGEHHAPLNVFSVFERYKYRADAHHDYGESHGFAVIHDQRQKAHSDHGGPKAKGTLHTGTGKDHKHYKQNSRKGHYMLLIYSVRNRLSGS